MKTEVMFLIVLAFQFIQGIMFYLLRKKNGNNGDTKEIHKKMDILMDRHKNTDNATYQISQTKETVDECKGRLEQVKMEQHTSTALLKLILGELQSQSSLMQRSLKTEK